MPPDDTILAQPPVIEGQPKTSLGPTPSKSKFADKFRAEFAKLEKEEKAETPPAKEEPVEPAEEPTKEAPPAEAAPKETPPAKVESPLDAVLAKPEPIKEEPDVVKEFDKVESPKSEDWKRARGVMKTQSEKIRELEGKITAPKATPEEIAAIAKERDELKAAIAERENTIKAINAEYSPEYQKLVGKYQGTAEKIKNRASSFGADGDALMTALALPYSRVRTDQIDSVLGELDAGKQARIQTLIEELEGQGEEIAEFRKDLPKKYDELAAQQEMAAREQYANSLKQLETEFVKISETIPDSIVTLREVPEDVPGGTEWNKEISEARVNALRILKPDGADFNESVQIALKGARYDTLEKRYLALHADHVTLKKQMAEYDSSGPDFKGGTKPKSGVKKSAPVKYHEALQSLQRGDMADA